ncbi:MAG: ABC transporter permease subunit [Chloroflexaceae bacterium]|nr:ABC transporter permease subunit [Chloroflexaceae bacterium]
MHSHPITIITRREVRETLSDWRIVLPIALLTFLMPLLLAGAAREVINVVEDPGLAGRLVPFAALLVGFIPASFSLITALESFVGERERNTLESILAMPVSDRALFISKFISSLATPLVSCMLAMTIFVLLLALFNPALYAAAMTPLRLLQLVTLVVLMAVVMVAAAVVISSHITTIRAANLMSSFVLLPMALVVQFAAFLIINQRWFELWLIAAALATAAVLLIRIGLSTFSREEILSREQTQGSLWRGGKRSETVSHTPFAANPVLAIVRRELVETLSDWRVLVPVLILAGVVPMALVLSAGFAVDFVGDLRQVGRLVPFAALLVGFVPASFSLITALESFVGERERNSLESLLAMPLSDGQLYVGKLYAALTVPIAASMVAILVFLGALAALHPALYAVAMGLEQIVLVLLMIAVVTVVMVAGAVVISSHTSSIRAATLLASLVLIPTAVTIQLQALPIIAARWDILWIVVSAMAVIAVALMRCGLKTFNREEIVSREHEQLSLPRLRQQFETFFCEYRPAGVVPEAYQGLPFSPMRFYRQEFPALLRELRLPLLLTLLALHRRLRWVLLWVCLPTTCGSPFCRTWPRSSALVCLLFSSPQ